jgi:hypothetical protein
LRTPGDWLLHEISNEIGAGTGKQLIEGMERVLGRRGSPYLVDDFLADEFFVRHLDRSNGEPSVWHISSRNGTVALLVPARRFTTQQIELIIAEVVGRAIDELERSRSSLVKKGDLEALAEIEEKLDDVRRLERSLQGLIAEPSGRRRGPLWKPDWARGTRANMAPLQAAGLLPFDVLGPDEMSELMASA